MSEPKAEETEYEYRGHKVELKPVEPIQFGRELIQFPRRKRVFIDGVMRGEIRTLPGARRYAKRIIDTEEDKKAS